MTKEQYIKYRGEFEIPSELFYEYWLEVKPPRHIDIPQEEFSTYFTHFLIHLNGNVVIVGGKTKVIELGKIYNKVCNYFNEKFEL